MNNEPQQIALRYKGEDYKDCTRQMMADGFQFKGFNKWYSPITGYTYRFVLADGGDGYVTRVELVTDEGFQMIITEFCDHEEAVARYNAEHARKTEGALYESINRFKDTHLHTSMSKVIRLIEKGHDDGDPDSSRLFNLICTSDKRKLVIKNYLFCHGVVCFYSHTRRTTHELVRILEHNGKKHYLYKARHYLEDLLESLISKVRLTYIIGEDAVNEISNESE